MPDAEFPEYGKKSSREALNSLGRIDPELWPALNTVEQEILDAPGEFEKLSVSEGDSVVYKHNDPRLEITFRVDEEDKVVYFLHYSAPVFKVQKMIFVSYSHEDEEWLTKLRRFLGVLEQQGLIDWWDDTKLQPGEPWRRQIEQALKSARAGLLLVSQEFLFSEFINTVELPQLLKAAEDGGKKIYWVHLSPSTVFQSHQEIARFQSLMEDPKTSLAELDDASQRKAMVEISATLADVIEDA